jgi:hypothetical protein
MSSIKAGVVVGEQLGVGVKVGVMVMVDVGVVDGPPPQKVALKSQTVSTCKLIPTVDELKGVPSVTSGAEGQEP